MGRGRLRRSPRSSGPATSAASARTERSTSARRGSEDAARASGVSVATTRLLATYQHFLGTHWSVGAVAGLVLRGGGPRPVGRDAREFFPFHLEGQVSWWPSGAPARGRRTRAVRPAGRRARAGHSRFASVREDPSAPLPPSQLDNPSDRRSTSTRRRGRASPGWGGGIAASTSSSLLWRLAVEGDGLVPGVRDRSRSGGRRWLRPLKRSGLPDRSRRSSSWCAALATTQLLAVRELVSALFGEEVVILLVNATLFAAISLRTGSRLECGASAAPGRSRSSPDALHLSLPALPRHAFAWLAAHRWNGVAPLVVAVVLAVVLLAPLSTLLPRAVAGYAHRPGHAMELQRRARRVLARPRADAALLRPRIEVLLALHWALLAVIAGLALGARGLAVVAVPAMLLWPSIPARARAASNALYRDVHGRRSADVVFSVDSPYQRVEVVDSGTGRRRSISTASRNLNATYFSRSSNEYLAIVPARLARPSSTLVIGNGTLSLVAPLGALSNDLLTVEIDPVVIAAGERFFSPNAGRENRLAARRRRRQVVPREHDAVVRSDRRRRAEPAHVPGGLPPHTRVLRARSLTPHAARRRLRPSEPGDRLGALERLPLRSHQMAALAAELPEVLVVESDVADRAFAYASSKLPFHADDVRAFAPPSETRRLFLARPIPRPCARARAALIRSTSTPSIPCCAAGSSA